ncbi:MAG: hypothetical protein LBJ64_05365 [Deltaproteobacteria bacterium]|jgi:cell division protein FtsW (lipid II flippase)|nr:hypothetical protein [Deltaproteobacteria bacterium]
MLKDLIKYVKTIDTLFVIFFFALLLSGAVVQLSASFAIAEFDKKDPYFIFNKHLKMMCGGVVVCFIAFFVPYK